MSKQFALCLATAGLFVAAPAIAQSYDFSTFSTNGQNYQGVTVGPMTLSSANGTLIYTDNYGGGLFDGNAGTSDVTMSFASAITSISVRAGDGAGDLDAFGLIAYEFGTNNLLGSFYSPQFGGPNEPEWYTLTVSGIGNIGRIVFDPCNAGSCPGSGTGTGGVAITDINVTVGAIPEPSTYALMIAGLGLLGWIGRRRAA